MKCPKCKSENTFIYTEDDLVFTEKPDKKFSPLLGLHCCRDCGKLFDESDLKEKLSADDLMTKVRERWGIKK